MALEKSPVLKGLNVPGFNFDICLVTLMSNAQKCNLTIIPGGGNMKNSVLNFSDPSRITHLYVIMHGRRLRISATSIQTDIWLNHNASAVKVESVKSEMLAFRVDCITAAHDYLTVRIRSHLIKRWPIIISPLHKEYYSGWWSSVSAQSRREKVIVKTDQGTSERTASHFDAYLSLSHEKTISIWQNLLPMLLCPKKCLTSEDRYNLGDLICSQDCSDGILTIAFILVFLVACSSIFARIVRRQKIEYRLIENTTLRGNTEVVLSLEFVYYEDIRQCFPFCEKIDSHPTQRHFDSEPPLTPTAPDIFSMVDDGNDFVGPKPLIHETLSLSVSPTSPTLSENSSVFSTNSYCRHLNELVYITNSEMEDRRLQHHDLLDFNQMRQALFSFESSELVLQNFDAHQLNLSCRDHISVNQRASSVSGSLRDAKDPSCDLLKQKCVSRIFKEVEDLYGDENVRPVKW
jgi:hypothetical protein